MNWTERALQPASETSIFSFQRRRRHISDVGGAPKEANAKRQEEERRKREGVEEEKRRCIRLLAVQVLLVLREQVSLRKYLKGSQVFIDMQGWAMLLPIKSVIQIVADEVLCVVCWCLHVCVQLGCGFAIS